MLVRFIEWPWSNSLWFKICRTAKSGSCSTERAMQLMAYPMTWYLENFLKSQPVVPCLTSLGATRAGNAPREGLSGSTAALRNGWSVEMGLKIPWGPAHWDPYHPKTWWNPHSMTKVCGFETVSLSGKQLSCSSAREEQLIMAMIFLRNWGELAEHKRDHLPIGQLWVSGSISHFFLRNLILTSGMMPESLLSSVEQKECCLQSFWSSSSWRCQMLSKRSGVRVTISYPTYEELLSTI